MYIAVIYICQAYFEPLVGLTALRIGGGRELELARVDDRPLQPLDGRRGPCPRRGRDREDPTAAIED